MTTRAAAVGLAACLLGGFAVGAAAGELCIVPSDGMAAAVTVDCGGAGHAMHPIEYVGFNSDGNPSCFDMTFNWCLVDRGGDPPLYYAWTISDRIDHPFSNTASEPLGFATLYLWYQCNTVDGMSTAEFDLGGDMVVLEFTPMNSFLNAGTATHLELSVGGCPAAPLVAGAISVYDGTVAVVQTNWGRVKALYR